MKPIALPLLLLTLAGCATAAPQSGQLSSYEGLSVRPGAVRTSLAERKDATGLAAVRRVSIEPTRFAEDAKLAWLTPQERTLLLREIDAQLCFELTERYDLAPEAGQADARVRAIVTRVAPTGRVASAAAAAAGFFIPGPIGLRAPGTTGGLGVEAEMISTDGAQLAALTWNRDAQPIGTDNPSLNRLGDALQFAEPFADSAAAAMTPPDLKTRAAPKPDPCGQYGSRLRVEGWAAKFATGLYVPQMSGARAADANAATSPDPAVATPQPPR
jgi:hypothetical protein